MRAMSVARKVVAVAATIVFGTTAPWALTAEQEAKLVPGNTDSLYFGTSVAVDGDTTLIGARSVLGTLGPAYVFTRTGTVWTEQAQLFAEDQEPANGFGAVALDGDTAVIGAAGDDDNGESSGSAFVFVRVGGVWTQQAKLLPADGAAGDLFGSGVALHGDTVVIGAPLSDDNGDQSGSAYVFTRHGAVWTQQAKLLPSDGTADDRCCSAVAVHGDTLVLGTPLSDDDNGVNAGAAYVFTSVGGVWSEQAKLLPADASPQDAFGDSVAVDGNTVVIGGFGSASVFDRTGSTWTEQSTLRPADLPSGAFLESVDLDGDVLVIGAVDDGYANPGSAYVFTRTGYDWTEQAVLLASDAQVADYFGMDAALDGNTAVIGAALSGSNIGAAYVFRLDPADADGDGIDDDADVCPDTVTPEAVPTHHLGVNRWALVDGDGSFDTTPPHGGGNGPDFELTLEDTRGCSCEQIIEAWALGWGQTKFGCSTGVMLQWIATVWNYDSVPVARNRSPGRIGRHPESRGRDRRWRRRRHPHARGEPMSRA